MWVCKATAGEPCTSSSCDVALWWLWPGPSGSAQILQPTSGQCSLRRLVCRLPPNGRLYVKGQILCEQSPHIPGDFQLSLTDHNAARRAAPQRRISVLGPSLWCYRVNMFRNSETLPVWFWECWYCRCCCCGCSCCVRGSCCVCGCCWMYPTVLCCETLVVCKKAWVDPLWTSPWVICTKKREHECTLGCLGLIF